MDYRDFPMDHSDDLSEVTLSTFGSSSQYDKNPVRESRKWGLLWKTKSPLQTAKKLKKTMKKKIRRESRESPETEGTIVEESSKSWGVHWPKSKTSKSYFEGVVDEDDAPDDEVPGRHPVDSDEEVSRSLEELNEKFRNQEKVDEYHLCRLELQEMKRNGRALSAEEVYELGLLERRASGEELYEEANDLDDFVEKRILYKRLQIDLADIRSQQLKGEPIDEDLLFVLELFEQSRLGQPLFTMEKLALDLLTRDRLGDTLTDAEMDELIDIMDMLRNKKNPAPTSAETNASPSESNSSLMVEDDGAGLEDDDAAPALDPWSNASPVDEARNDVEKDNTATAGAGGGWLMYWRSNHQQQDAEQTRERIQKELLDKALLKAELLMEIDNLKSDLKKVNASVLELGGEPNETTRVILNEGGLPAESMPEEPGIISSESLQMVRSECDELKEDNQDKESKIATLEAQVRELRAKTVTSARKGSAWGKQAEESSVQDSETISQLSAECAQLNEQLKEVNEKYDESRESHDNTCARLAELQIELEQCSQDLQAAREELEIREKEMQNAAFEFSALNVRYKAASSKIERLEEEYPESIKERVAELLEEAGKTGGIDVLVDYYESAVATIGALEEKLESAEEEAMSSNKMKTEYNYAVEMSKELEKDVDRLQSKLEVAKSEATKAQEEKFRVSEEIEEVRLKMEDLEVKLISAEKEAAAANKRQVEYCESAENNKKLENDMAELQIKLDAAESEVTNANDEKQRVTNEIADMTMKMKDLEAKLEAAEQEIVAATKSQAEFDNAVAMCKKLEKDSEELQSKLEAAELEATKANEEKNRAYEAIAEAKSQITNVGAKLKAAEEETAATASKKQAEYEKAVELCKLLEENAKELQSKLEAAESESRSARDDRENVLVEIATMRVQMRSLEAKLGSAQEEVVAANKRRSEYDNSVKMCNKLEGDVGDLKSKLQAAEAKVTQVTKEKKTVSEAVAEAKLKIAEGEKKINALAQQVQHLEGENYKLLEENLELKELCEEMIAGMGDDAVDC